MFRLHQSPWHAYIQRVWNVGGGIHSKPPPMEFMSFQTPPLRNPAKKWPFPETLRNTPTVYLSFLSPKRTLGFPIFLSSFPSSFLGDLESCLGVLVSIKPELSLIRFDLTCFGLLHWCKGLSRCRTFSNCGLQRKGCQPLPASCPITIPDDEFGTYWEFLVNWLQGGRIIEKLCSPTRAWQNFTW